MKKPAFNVGGEAVIEGVMMRSPHFYAVAVRRADKKLTVTADPVNSMAMKYSFLKWPILRGILGMWESLSLGMRALTYSANIMEADLAKEDAKQGKAPAKPRNEALDNTISFSVAIVLAVALFILLPYGINRLIARKFAEMNTNRYLFNICMVVFKFSIFFLYVWGISFLPDVKRLFQYHGAEHKTIYAFEAGKSMNIASVKPYSTRHPRCGTAFIIVTVLISLILFVIFLPAQLKIWQRVLFEIPLIIPIVGISYELLKLSDKWRDNPLVKLFIAPGLAFQRLTTREPDKGQMETAIKALNTVVALENAWIKRHGTGKNKNVRKG